MTRSQCPVPQVEDVLKPYIHSRERTTRIRQILTRHLVNQVKSDGEATHLSLSFPVASHSHEADGSTSSATGLHSQYLEAVLAHRRASKRYRTLQEQVEDDKHSPRVSTPDLNGESIAAVQDYAALLRQRRHHRKLEIVQNTLLRLLETEPNPTAVDLQAAVKEGIGEPPHAPVTALSGDDDAGANIEHLTFQLKKELLSAKSKYAAEQTANAKAGVASEGIPSASAEAQTGIVRQARDELVHWVENELAKIPDDEMDASQIDVSLVGEDSQVAVDRQSTMTREQLTHQAKDLYTRYVAARNIYVAEVESALVGASLLEKQNGASSGALSQGAQRLDAKPAEFVSASSMLPYYIDVTSSTHDEALLQQQASHLRRQLTEASSETARTVRRLAGESLMVPQNSISVGAWAKAASENSEKTKALVLEQVIDGQANISKANRTLEGLRSRRNALENLRRDL